MWKVMCDWRKSSLLKTRTWHFTPMLKRASRPKKGFFLFLLTFCYFCNFCGTIVKICVISAICVPLKFLLFLRDHSQNLRHQRHLREIRKPASAWANPCFLGSLDQKTLRDHCHNLRHPRYLRALKISALSALSAGHYKKLPLREPFSHLKVWVWRCNP